MDLIAKAEKIMREAHAGQTRKQNDTPYITHPQAVAKKLAAAKFSEIVQAAALVHDVLEDTDYPAEKLKTELGDEVYKMVQALSENKSLVWEERKLKYLESIKNSSEKVKAISLADKIHNLEDLIAGHVELGPAIWELFNRGKDKKIWFENQMLAMFQKTWAHPMIAEYAKLIKQAEQLA